MKFLKKYILIKALSLILLFSLIITLGLTYFFSKRMQIRLMSDLKNKTRTLSKIGSRLVGNALEFAIRSKILTRQDLFDRNYQKINDPRFIMKRYHTKYDFYTDVELLRIQDEFLRDPEIAYAFTMDQGGYIPTHNTVFQRPLLPNISEQNRNKNISRNRTKIKFNFDGNTEEDKVARKCSVNKNIGLIQKYKRYTGKMLWDVSTPIYVTGQRWGSFRIGVSLDRVNAMVNHVQRMFIIGGLITFLVFVLISVLILHFMVLTKVRKINNKIKLIAEGDLSIRTKVKGNDEIGQTLTNLNSMTDSLDNMISDVYNGTEIVVSAAEEILQGNQNLSSRTESQAAALEETASAMEEMTSTVKQNSDSANEANKLAMTSREKATKGGDVVRKSVEAMKGINASSKKITEIINVIDEIAFQTNLLALNAAVEAARAGEQGRGFAVVAVEVRNLAGRSSQAAKEIYNLIQNSNEKVSEGAKLVNKSGEVFNDLITDIKKLADFISEVASASKEQYVGINEVNRAITQMDEMTQQNAALVEEISAASLEMKNRISELRHQVQFFNVTHLELDTDSKEHHTGIELLNTENDHIEIDENNIHDDIYYDDTEHSIYSDRISEQTNESLDITDLDNTINFNDLGDDEFEEF